MYGGPSVGSSLGGHPSGARALQPRLSSLGENAVAGQECPAYRVFEIAAFIPAPAYRQAGKGLAILQHFRKRLVNI